MTGRMDGAALNGLLGGPCETPGLHHREFFMRTMTADLIAGLQAAIRELDIDLSDKKKGRQAGEPDGQGNEGGVKQREKPL